MRLLLIYRRRWWLFYLPVLAAAAAALWWSVYHGLPIPPRQAVIAAGSPQGSYAVLARRYAEQLERMGVKADIVFSANPQDALARLSDPRHPAHIGFAHGTDAPPRSVQALAVVGQEPVWVFSAAGGPQSLAQAHGLRVATGPACSSSPQAARLMLAHAGVPAHDVIFAPLADVAASHALLDGQADLVFHCAGEDAQAVHLLLRQQGIQLLGTDHAGALAAQARQLQPLLLPQGAIELRGDVPPRDLTLMSLRTHLLIRPELHPALQRALIDVAISIHEVPTFLQRHGQFPSFTGSDFPLSPAARAYSLGSRPWLEGLLPYRTAQYAALLLYAVLPIALMTVLLLTWIPRLFDWRVNAALHHFYGDLKFLESEMDTVAASQPIALRGLLQRLDAIEERAAGLDLPDEFSERWYTLRQHLAATRQRLLNLRAR